MSRTLVLVRHAKTASDPPGGVGGDHARALTDRGHRDAAAAAAWLANNDVNVDAALISTARRTVQTAELLGRAIPIEGAELADDVYAAAARSEEHTSELQSRGHLVCRLLLEKKNILDRLDSF